MPGVLWREVRVSEDMVDPLDYLAKNIGDDIYVRPIKGFGSYSDNDASANIDAGGGHVDLSLSGLSRSQKLRLEALARQIGFYADIREPEWYSPLRKVTVKTTWGSHLHMVKKDTRDLSDPARRQLNQWYAGFNGLAGFWLNGIYTYDADDGPRQYLRQTWIQFKEKLAMGETLTTDTTVAVSGSVARLMGLKDGNKWSVVGMIKYACAGFFLLSKEVKPQIAAQARTISELRGEIRGLSEIMKQLQTSGSVDMTAVVEASRTAARDGALEGAALGAESAIDAIIDDATVQLNVTKDTTS